MKHKEIKSFAEFPLKLKVLVLGHFVFALLLFLFLYNLFPEFLIIYLLIAALLVWLSMGLSSLKDVYRRWDRRVFSYISVLSIIGVILNIVLFGPFVRLIWLILIFFVSIGVIFYLSSDEVIDIYYHPTGKNQTIAWRDT